MRKAVLGLRGALPLRALGILGTVGSHLARVSARTGIPFDIGLKGAPGNPGATTQLQDFERPSGGKFPDCDNVELELLCNLLIG